MKQLLSLFLFFLPCLALAQYPSNGNQKITLGEQTTADGLIWRGVASDTTLTAKSDTAAYFVLDTANLNLYTYKASATGQKWRQLGADTASIAYVNTYGDQTVNGLKTFSSALTATRFNPTANTATGTGMFAPTSTSLGFSTNDVNRVTITSIGNFGLGVTPAAWASTEKAIQLPNDFVFAGGTSVGALFGINAYFQSPAYKYLSNAQAVIVQTTKEGAFWVRRAPTGAAGNTATFSTSTYIDSTGNMILGNSTSPTEKLHVVGNGRFTAVGAGAFSNNLNITSTGVLTTATSDEKFKYNIRPLNYGLETLLQLNPVNFQWIEGEEEDLGFIAQDVAEIIPEAVNTNWNSDLLFRYESLIPILTKAIQEQQALIKVLEQRIINLENK
jgi:hypothetical protein